MKIQLSFDDWCPENLRLADVIMKAGFQEKTIFFIEAERPDQLEQIKTLHNWGFEIGSHTMTHPPDLKLLPPELLDFELKVSKKRIEETIQDKIKWFCYPKGKFNEKVKDHVKKYYKYARTVHTGYWISPDPLEQRPTVHIYPHKKYGNDWEYYGEKMLRDVSLIDEGTFHLWGHAWEIEKFNNWDKLERFLKHLKGYEK